MLIGQQATQGETTQVFAMAEDGEDGQTVFRLRDHVFDRLNKKPADFWEKPVETAAEGEDGQDAEDTIDSEVSTQNKLEEEQM